jgi:HPr kinase/phosphorylase
MSQGSLSLTVHASVVALEGRAVLILGGSGAGKSGLALQMIARGAAHVADDRVMLRRRSDGRLTAAAPQAIEGLIEARGIGILRMASPPGGEAEVVLAVDLDRAPETRMSQSRSIAYLDSTVRLIFGRDVPNLGAILTLVLQGTAVMPD